MRSFTLALLASMALAVVPASAIYVEGYEPPTYEFADVTLDLLGADCPDGPAPCFLDANGTLFGVIRGTQVNLTLVNHLDRDVTVVIATNGHDDDPVDNGGKGWNFTANRSVQLHEVQVPAGATVETVFEVPDDARALRLTGSTAADTFTLDHDTNMYVLAATGVPEGEPQGNLDDDVPADDADPEPAEDQDKAEPKGAPGLPLVGALAALALVASFWRRK